MYWKYLVVSPDEYSEEREREREREREWGGSVRGR